MGFINKYFICFYQCLLGSFFYWMHRFFIYISTAYRHSFFRGFFPDYLALIVCIPIFATTQKWFSLRKKNKVYFVEIILYWGLFSIYFEIIGPKYVTSFTSDYLDVVAYLLGGLTLYLSNLWYNKKSHNKGS